MAVLPSARVSFFLATSQAAEAKKFYADTLGLSVVEDNEFALVFELQGAELRISKVPGFEPFPWTVLDWQVPDIHEIITYLVSRGVEFTRFNGMDQDDHGVWTTPDGSAKIAWFRDPDGNVLSVSERS